jgi:5-methylcytosine-specific restriction protein A
MRDDLEALLPSRPTDRIRGRRGQDIRARFLHAHPLCRTCLEQGRTTEATEVDHIIPLHKGGPESDDNRQALCVACHKAKTADDVRRKAGACNLAGDPIDPMHPWNRGP